MNNNHCPYWILTVDQADELTALGMQCWVQGGLLVAPGHPTAMLGSEEPDMQSFPNTGLPIHPFLQGVQTAERERESGLEEGERGVSSGGAGIVCTGSPLFAKRVCLGNIP